jgi:hypothetical protein
MPVRGGSTITLPKLIGGGVAIAFDGDDVALPGRRSGHTEQTDSGIQVENRPDGNPADHVIDK